MSRKILTPWERIAKIMYENQIDTPSEFAKKIGLTRGETIFQIKRGNHGISRRLAEKIAAAFPEVEEYWLLQGKHSEGAPLPIPLYRGDAVGRFRRGDVPDNYVVTPYESLRPVSFAMVNQEAEPLRGILEHSVLLLESVERERMELGRPHLVETAGRVVLRYIDDDYRTGHYRLYSNNPAWKGVRIVEPMEITAVYALRYVLTTF
ncbi:MAG: hypothetical protein LIO77_10445 [Rikenellaceae bacterium]|nr:hypothetical protein [Rikenellaceae bacterium]